MGDDRRSEERITAALSVDYDDAQDLVSDYTENLSKGGACVSSTKVFDPGADIRLSLSFPGLVTPIRLEGVVRWCRDHMIGIEFVPSARGRLDDVIARVRAADPALLKRAIRVLVVEDNPHIAALLRQGLGSDRNAVVPGISFHCSIANDGRAALGQLREQPVDLMIVDVYLPILDGASLIATTRRELSRDVPIIAVSGGGDAARRAAIAAGANLFIDKPMRLRDLLNSMREIMKLEVPR